MFVVLGATGNTGSAVVETLLSKKQPVRVIVRSVDKGAGWKAKGADVAVASLDDVPALAKAFEGAKGSICWCRRIMGRRPGWRINDRGWIARQKPFRRVESNMLSCSRRWEGICTAGRGRFARPTRAQRHSPPRETREPKASAAAFSASAGAWLRRCPTGRRRNVPTHCP